MGSVKGQFGVNKKLNSKIWIGKGEFVMKSTIKKYSFELLLLTAFLVIVLGLILCGILVYREVSHVCKEYNVYEEASNREKDLEDRKISPL